MKNGKETVCSDWFYNQTYDNGVVKSFKKVEKLEAFYNRGKVRTALLPNWRDFSKPIGEHFDFIKRTSYL